jgi:hypothetical protein
MKASVREKFVWFTARYEGVVPWMYLDVKGLVTTAIGNLIDPIQYALPLPFVHPDGRAASKDEIAAEWARVKNHPTAAKDGHRILKAVTSLRLTEEGIAKVVGAKLDLNWTFLKGRFPEIDSWPADAQLATLSMAWACGPAFRFRLLEAALRAQNFAMAAIECKMDTRGNPGLVPRNVANKILYRNAHVVGQFDVYNPETLYYPRDLNDERETEPEFHYGPPEDDDEPTPPPTRRAPVISDLADFRKVYTPPPLRGQEDDDPDDAA